MSNVQKIRMKVPLLRYKMVGFIFCSRVSDVKQQAFTRTVSYIKSDMVTFCHLFSISNSSSSSSLFTLVLHFSLLLLCSISKNYSITLRMYRYFIMNCNFTLYIFLQVLQTTKDFTFVFFFLHEVLS